MEGEREVGGLRCSEVLARLDGFVDGTLAPEEQARVIAHVSGCALCERFGGTYAETTRRIRAAAAPPEPSDGVLDRLLARLELSSR